jgi:DNA repair exonuclease SbcCD ATPase subunit
MICEYCNNEFSSDKSLYNHQKRTKYCLEKQNKYIICCGCDKSFSGDNYKNHILNCVNYLQNKLKELEQNNKELEQNNKELEQNNKELEQNNKFIEQNTKDLEQHNKVLGRKIEILEEKIKELEDENRDIIYFQNENDNLKQKNIDIEKHKKEQIEYLQEQIKLLQEQIISVTKVAVAKPTTTNNTTINNKILNMPVLNFDNNNIKHIIDDKYNTDIIACGQKGIAKFATNYLLKDDEGNLNYICTDVSRKIFKFKNELGELEKDVNAKKLTNILSENGLIEKTSNLSQQFWTNEDGTIDQDKFLSIIEKASEIKNIKEDNTIFKNELANMTSV